MGNEGFLYHVVDVTWRGEQVTQWEFTVLLKNKSQKGLIWAVDRSEAVKLLNERYVKASVLSVRPRTILVE